MLPELPGRYLVAPGTVLVDPGSTADRTWSCLVPGTRVPARRDACLIATLAGSPSAHSRHSPCASFRYLAVPQCVRNISPLPPRCWFICRRREKDDVPRDRHRRNAKTATGLPVGLHAEHMCNTRRLRLGLTRRSFGCGLCSHELSPTARVSSNEVVCHATELVARRGTDRTVRPYSPISPVRGCTARSGGQQARKRGLQPVAWAPGTWLVDLVALRAVLVGNW